MNEIDQLKQRIRELEQELAAVRQLYDRNLFMLRSPLVPITGFMTALLDDETEEHYSKEERREFYEIVLENAARLSRINEETLNSIYRRNSNDPHENRQEYRVLNPE